MAHGWEGEKIRLVPLDKEKHIENALLWLNDPEITRWIIVGDFPLTRLREESWFDKMAKQDDKGIGFAVETLEGEHVGFTGFHNIEWRHGVSVVGTIIGPAANWGKGYGHDVIRVRTRYAFEVLGLRLILSEVMAGNDGMLRLLERNGYREAGRAPGRWWKRGSFRDAITLYKERDKGAGR